MTTTKTLQKADLAQFTGSEQWFRHALVRSVLFTDGAKHVADAGGAYWLLDEIALAQRYKKRVAAEEFQNWTLKVKDDNTARPHLRRRQRQCRLHEADSVHGFSATRDQPLFLQQHHPVAERVLTEAEAAPLTCAAFFAVQGRSFAAYGAPRNGAAQAFREENRAFAVYGLAIENLAINVHKGRLNKFDDLSPTHE